jgi:hypothetical protein
LEHKLGKYYSFVVVALVALLHLPFIHADPDSEVSTRSRGAWTDEGLNTVQIRNYVNHGYLSMDECDNLIKTPLFGFGLVPFYKVLGPHIWVGRVLVLSSLLFVLFLFLRRKETQLFGTVLAIIGLLQFHVFQYSHYSLAEMLGVSWILLGIYLLWRHNQNQKWSALIISTVCFSLAYYSKITFVYAVGIPFTVTYLQFLSDRIMESNSAESLWKNWSMQGLVTAFFGGLFYFKWFKPNQVVFDMVQANQGEGRFDIVDAWNRFSFNLEHFISVDGFAPMVWLIPVAFLLLSVNGKIKNGKETILFGLIVWFVIELHHALLVNPPTRYLIPLFFSALAFVSFSLAEFSSQGIGKKMVLGVLVLIGGYNLSNYANSISRKSSEIETVRMYLANYDLSETTILGVWGTTLASETQARCIPIWSDFNMKEQPLQEYQPRIIFAEKNEAGSGEAFLSKAIDLEAEADSVKQFNIWRYKVNLYWMPE